MFFNHIVEYNITDDTFDLFSPYDWFGSDIDKQQSLALYKGRLYKSINRAYKEN